VRSCNKETRREVCVRERGVIVRERERECELLPSSRSVAIKQGEQVVPCTCANQKIRRGERSVRLRGKRELERGKLRERAGGGEKKMKEKEKEGVVPPCTKPEPREREGEKKKEEKRRRRKEKKEKVRERESCNFRERKRRLFSLA
jgi:hypothetical protein